MLLGLWQLVLEPLERTHVFVNNFVFQPQIRWNSREAMAQAGSDGLICISGGDLMNATVDNHEAPIVIARIMKQNCTECGRCIIEYLFSMTLKEMLTRRQRSNVLCLIPYSCNMHAWN